MNKSLCLHIIYFVLLVTAPNELKAYKFGLGSCLHQDQDQPIWDAIDRESVDSFIFLGDNVYGDTRSGKLDRMEQAYKKQKLNLPSWLSGKEILTIWDDHDYGLNDGGSDYPNKAAAQTLFMDFWDIPANDSRRQREGIYFNHLQVIEGLKVQVIGLDTRYFRSKLTKGNSGAYQPNQDPLATVLGANQWLWLEQTLQSSYADLIILLSSIQILATNHRYEKWANFPLERLRLLEFIEQHSKSKTIIAISGDRHRSGIYQYNNFIEFTASGLNKAGSKNNESDPLLLTQTYPENNFGLLDINPRTKELRLSIQDVNGLELESVMVPIK